MKTEKEIKDEIRHIKNGIKTYKKRGFDTKELEADLLQLNWVLNDPTEKEKAIDEILEHDKNVDANNWKERLNELIKNCVVMRSISSSAKLESFIENLLENQKGEIRDRMQKELKEIYKSSAFITDPFYIGKCQGEINSYMHVLEWLGVIPKEVA